MTAQTKPATKPTQPVVSTAKSESTPKPTSLPDASSKPASLLASGTQSAAPALPTQLLASVLSRLRQDKEEHLRAEWQAQRVKADEEDARARQDALLATMRKAQEQTTAQHVLNEEEQAVARIRSAAAAKAADVAREGALRARLQEFRGSDDASIGERLRKEGFGDALTENNLRLRTLDQRVGNELGLKPGQSRGPEKLYLSDAAAESAGKFYSSGEEKLYRSELPAAVTGPAPGGYEQAREQDKEAGVRKGLGLDSDHGLTYGRSK